MERSTNNQQSKMKAVVYHKYGPPEVLQLEEIEKPIPKENEILIRTYATSVSAGDWRLRKADPFLARIFNGLFKPTRVNILGFEIAGIIEQVGNLVTEFKTGDAVFAFCGLKFGGYAEYCCLNKTDIILPKPKSITFTEAATFPLGSLTAWYFLKKASLCANQRILIYGASGSVGSFAIQLAKNLKAEVTAVCGSKNIDLVKSLGANYAIDYTKISLASLNETFDVIFDAVGKAKKSDCKAILKPGGRYVSVRSKTKFTKQDLQHISTLIDDGQLTSTIDRVFTLETISEAHAYVEQFRKKGNVAVQIIT